MAGFFSVEHAAVKGHATNLQDAVGKFTSNSSEFESAMDDLLGKIEGGAKDALSGLKDQWKSAADQVNKALGQLGSRTEQVSSDYTQGESSQNDTVRASGSHMNFHDAESTHI
ncbi:WXG100 family type VII secretion target [Gordonia sp. TBRC 11910]|uniref:WXG100 family type VII secretion target n=1 Tax=Gordonia asplenii TaxID=2725283 RepID=A0A848KQ65_9ACTN|nr:WXG100 family type VII secretion target [Gordonia asplenii]NMO00480.1 WXG100 family type VII secretion target [Gordonia asplenii]